MYSPTCLQTLEVHSVKVCSVGLVAILVWLHSKTLKASKLFVGE